MNKDTHKLFAELKKACNTNAKRKAYNELIKSFASDASNEFIADIDIMDAIDMAEDKDSKETINRIAKILGKQTNKLKVADNGSGEYITEDSYDHVLKSKPISVSGTIDLGTKNGYWYGEGELITTSKGNKIFCQHDSGGYAFYYF